MASAQLQSIGFSLLPENGQDPRQTAEENCLPQDLDHHDYKDWKPSLPHIGLQREC